MHTLYRRLASITPTADRYSNTGDTDSQSVSPSVTPNYDVINPDIVLVANLQWRDTVITLGRSLLLIQQRYSLCGVLEEHSVTFGPIKNLYGDAINIARGRAIRRS